MSKGKIELNRNGTYVANLNYKGTEKLNYLWFGDGEHNYIGHLSNIKDLKRLQKWIETIIKNRKRK